MLDDDAVGRLSLSNILINQYLLKNRIDPEKYTFNQFFNRYIATNNIAVFENIPKIEKEFFLGVTVRSENSIAMFINPIVYEPRKNFSKCHELNHVIFDMNHKLQSQNFFNVDNNPSFYSKDELHQEYLANTGAGVLMLPDIVIIKYMESNISFYQMAENLMMSNAALYTRLVQFCMQHFKYDYNYASNLIKRFQTTGNKQHINMALSGYGSSRKKQIVLDYENSI